MPFTPLETDTVTATYDDDTRIATISYQGLLGADTTIAVYDWLGDLIDEVGFENLYGEIFDFRNVREFLPDNLMEARRKSRRYNMRNNVRRLPVAMIVSSHYQEEILRGPLQNVEENKRKTIVWTMEDAIAFLHAWHAANRDDDPQATE